MLISLLDYEQVQSVLKFPHVSIFIDGCGFPFDELLSNRLFLELEQPCHNLDWVLLS